MLTQTKVKARECDIKKKLLISDLVRHFRIYLGEKPYGCAEFEKWFNQTSIYALRTRHKEPTVFNS